jgi:hypothetical protein
MEDSLTKIPGYQKRYFMPLFVGIVGGLAALVVPWQILKYVRQQLWDSIYSYNTGFNDIPTFQFWILFILGSIIISAVSVLLSGSVIRKNEDVILAGTLSGLSAGFIFGGFILLDSQNAKFHFDIYSEILPFIITIGISIIIQIFGSYLNYSINPVLKSQRTDTIKTKPEKNNTIIFVIIGFVCLLCIAIIPPLLVYSGIMFGMVEQQTFCNNIEMVSVSRISSDSIILTQYTGEPENRLGPPPKRLCYQIFINDKNVSDISAIREQHMTELIIPAEGLHFGKGSSVILTGPTISNSTGPVDVRVIENLHGGKISEQVMGISV